MPVLGAGGVLELRRELPPPTLVSVDAVAVSANALDFATDGFWTGDKVWVWGPRGLPFDLNGDDLPDVTGGWGMFFGSRWLLYGERKRRLSDGTKKWFGTEDPFRRPAIDGVTDRLELFVYRDELDRLSFYRTFAEALTGSPENRIELYAVDFRFLLIAPAGSSGYQERLAAAYPELGSYRMELDRTEIRLDQVTTAPEAEPIGAGDDRPWSFVLEVEDWSLELDAADIDTTALGERFGESTRARVTGGGTLNYFVNRSQSSLEEIDATGLARLLITLEQGSTAEAIFNVTHRRENANWQPGYQRLPTANLSYKAPILLVSTVTNTAADDVIRGSARFVTVGRIRLDIN